MKKYQSKLFILALMILSFSGVQAAEVTTTFADGNNLSAGQMNEIKDAVNDNNTRAIANETRSTANETRSTANETRSLANETRSLANETRSLANETQSNQNKDEIDLNTPKISVLEGKVSVLEDKSPAIGRIVVPVVSVSGGTASISGASGILPDAESSTAFGGSFGIPSDYISGDVTVKAIIGGCGGSSIAHSLNHPGLSQVNIGANTSGFFSLACTFGTCPTVSIPANTGTFPFITTFSVEVVSTFSSISDINTPLFTRFGADSGDTCVSNLTVHSFIVEYPRG